MADQVVGLGAWCDLVPPAESTASPGSVSFEVREFAVLADGRRVTLHAERGFSLSLVGAGADPWAHLTAQSIESGVRTTVLPDEDDTQDEHPYEWLRGLLQQQDVVVTTASLRSVPYVVELSERLRHRLADRSRPTDQSAAVRPDEASTGGGAERSPTAVPGRAPGQPRWR